MDLYSTARRLAEPFVFDGTPRRLPIGARGLIGDGMTCALVRCDGAIDWLCMPRFDSPSVFGALLDEERGGVTSITPTGLFESLQRYDPDTNVLETLFRVGSGIVRLVDFMPWTDNPRSGVQEIHRRIEGMEGDTELEIVFDPRFDYGREPATFERSEHGILATSSDRRLAAIVGAQIVWQPREQGGLKAKLRIARGQRVWMVLSWDSPHPEHISAYRSYEHLRATRHRWRRWERQLTYDGPWRHEVIRSALMLKLLIHAPTGGMVAAPTTSLPEWLGGERNWDYRYTWTRDAAMAVRAGNLIGCHGEARDFFHFMENALTCDETLQVMYTLDGGPVPEEQHLEHLRGFDGSAPVRIGNGARDQVQNDIAGALIDAAHLYEVFGGSLELGTWRRLRRVVDNIAKAWRNPDHGIWEPRSGMRHNVHSKLMSWMALDRGSGIARLFGNSDLSRQWFLEGQNVRGDILARGLDARKQHFVAAYGEERPDAALLLIPIVGLLEPNDPRVVRTIEEIRHSLGTGPFLSRYHMDDGFSDPEGAFVLCGFWFAEALAMQGRIEEAREVFVAHAEDASNHLGLLAEEINPSTGELLGNFPQAFSHLGLINAAMRIDRAQRLRDEGRDQVPHLIRSSESYTERPPTDPAE